MQHSSRVHQSDGVAPLVEYRAILRQNIASSLLLPLLIGVKQVVRGQG